MQTVHPDLVRAQQIVSDYQSLMDKLNASPNVTPQEAPGGNDSIRRILTGDEMVEMREQLRGLSTQAVFRAFSLQARQKNTGIPLDVWLAGGGRGLAEKVAQDPYLAKALDTTSGSALVRQDLEPVMYESFVRIFPAWDRIFKEPANGLVHTFTKTTDPGDAEFISELGTVVDDRGTYVRDTTNIAIIGTRRGVTLKEQFAALQSGSGFNPEEREMRSALIAVAKKMQHTIFQGNAEDTESGGTAADEAGLFDANGFSGLRQILNTSDAKTVDPFAATPEDMRAAIDDACIPIGDNGGMASIVYASMTNKHLFDIQQDKNVRYQQDLVDVAVGVLANAVNTQFGPLPLVSVPGPSIGTYTRSAQSVGDIYVLDESTISMPYLGSEGPTVIEIPTGVSGQLTRLFIVFGMWGLATKVPTWSNKVRVHQD